MTNEASYYQYAMVLMSLDADKARFGIEAGPNAGESLFQLERDHWKQLGRPSSVTVKVTVSSS